MNSPQRPHVSRREFAKLEGCDEKQVRRGIESGKLAVDDDGKLDPAQVGTGWRKPRSDTRERGADRGADSAKPVRKASKPVGEGAGTADAPDLASAAANGLKAAVQRKEDFAGRLKELEYLQRAGQLVDLQLARQILFDEFRAGRDAWLNWPAKYAALIAADLGVEADRVAEVLTGYVHKQLAALGEPGGQFRQG